MNNKIKRGTVKQIKKVNGKTKYFFFYSAEYSNNQYMKNRENSRKPLKLATAIDFIKYAELKTLKEGYSPDVVCGRARLLGLFNSKTSIYTKTLYNYINSCLIKVRNIDLKYKVVRKNKPSKINIPSNHVLGLSIEKRPSQIDSRKSFGHFEIVEVVLFITANI